VKRDVVDKLKEGMEAESADLGMIVTTGTFSDDAIKAATEYFEDSGIRIELVDGEQFAKMIVEHGYK
jgi:restriction endonuclease Mrr